MKLLDFLIDYIDFDEDDQTRIIIGDTNGDTKYIESTKFEDIKFKAIYFLLNREVISVSAKDNTLVIEID